MGIHLPGMSGIEALGELRAKEATRAIPVLAFTASVMPQDRHTITNAGFDGFLSKPIAIKELGDTIASALSARGEGWRVSEPARILVVDDVPNNVKLLADLLKVLATTW